MFTPVYIEEAKVREILDADTLIALMKDAMIRCSEGTVIQPLRSIHKFPEGKLFGFMPAYLGDDYFGAKIVTAVPANHGTEYPSHLGSVLVFDSKHGVLRGMVDATSITELRTGAVSAVATDLLARKDASVMAVIGCGAQARSHISAITRVRDLKEIRVYDRVAAAMDNLKALVEEKYGINVTVCQSVEEAVSNADIVCTVTPSVEPYLKKEWIKKGCHINAVGTFSPTTREVTSELVAASRLYADEVSAMLRECGEYLIPVSEGLIDESHIVGSIGDVILGKVPARQNDEEITLFDSLGLAVEDIACAKYVYLKVTNG